MRLRHLEGIDLQIDSIALANSKGYRLLVEAEDFDAHEDLGGYAIMAYPETGCGGGYYVYGLDTTGEWMQYNRSVAQDGPFQIAMICRGQFNVSYNLRLEFTNITATETVTWGAVKSMYE